MAIGNNLLIIGIILLFFGIILIFTSSLIVSKEKNVKLAGGIMVGPFPLFGAFSDKNMFWVLVGLFVLGMISWLIFRGKVI